MKWIDSTHLKQWADRKEAQTLLPYLIRRLIQASCTPKNLQFPSGDAVWLPGYDGILEVIDGTQYIPRGESVWECGCDTAPKSKANKDYAKRTEKPLSACPSETEFIFVTPRVFTDKERWKEEKQKECVWKNVRVYDANDIENWLEEVPAVSAWLLEPFTGFASRQSLYNIFHA